MSPSLRTSGSTATTCTTSRTNLSFSFTVSPSAGDLTAVSLLLMDGSAETSCALLRYPFQIAASPGSNTQSLPTPTCVAPGTDYRIRVLSSPTLFTDSQAFAITQSNEECVAGEYNANGGREPGCLRCPVGSFSTQAGESECTNCTDGTTTSYRGATSTAACNVTVLPADRGYLKFDKTYFYHSNAGGLLMEEHQHVTLAECQRICLSRPGCKAFDAGGTVGTFPYGGPPMPGNGALEVFQAGSCFMSYDTIATIKAGDVGMTNSLELFQKVEAQRVNDIFFRKISGCYIHESNDGGAFKDEHSPEACGQLCLNDKSCVSYDAGTVRAGTDGMRWQPAIDDCFLSYKTRRQVPSADFVCDPDAGLDYYERIIPRYLEIDMNFDTIGSWDREFRDEVPNLQAYRDWSDGEVAFWQNYHSCSPQPACRSSVPRPRRACPVTWSYDSIIGGLYPFIGTREDFAAEVQTTITEVLGVSTAGIVTVRVEKSTLTRGEDPSQARTTAVINTGSAESDNMFDRYFRNQRSISIAGQDYTVRGRAASRCAAGHASQSGFTPGCRQCPPNSFANWPQTDCLPCPLGTASDAGSSTTGEKACRPEEDTSAIRLGPFRVGFEWFGFYQTPLGVDGLGRMGRGQIKLTVTSATASEDSNVELTVFATVIHGEDCNYRAGCRRPGKAEFFMNGYVSGSTVSLSPGRTAGHTDNNQRLFARGDIYAEVSVRDRNTIMSGAISGGSGQEGTLTAYERCHSADETGTFEPGNKFVGTYSCYRRGTNMESQGFGNDPCEGAAEGNLPEQDIRRIELLVTTFNDETGVIQGSINFDHAEGEGEYHVSGTYDNTTGAILFDAGAGAWNSQHPASIPARQLSGRLSDDKEFFFAQFNSNPNCACNGTQNGGQGGTCSRDWSIFPSVNDPWCFVSSDCPDATAAPNNMANTYITLCNADRSDYASTTNIYQTCTDVTLARICSTSAPHCEVGWRPDPVQDRCLRLSTTFASGTAMSFADADQFCQSFNASLASVHSMVENRFIMDPSFPNGLYASSTSRTPLWIGINSTIHDGSSEVVQEWVDGTRWGQFTQLANTGTRGCGYLSPNLRWVVDDCSAQRNFVCWKPPVGRVMDSCACTGQTDDEHFGGYCGFWSDRTQPSWCYVSGSCVTGVRIEDSELRRANCFYGESASTTPMPTTTAAVTVAPIGCADGQYQRMGNGGAVCANCTVWADCDTGEFLDGECSTYSSPVCQLVPEGMFLTDDTPPELGLCDVRCRTCSDHRANGCTSCVSGTPLYLEAVPGMTSGPCVSDCEQRNQFKHNQTQTCVTCTDPGDQIPQLRCGEYTDTQCVAAAGGCPQGRGLVGDGSSGCCAPCIAGSTFSASTGTLPGFTCRDVSECVGGQQERIAPTATADRVCEACPIGTFSLDGTECQPLTTCPAGSRMEMGSAAASQPPFSDRSCVACVDGTYSTSPNRQACIAVVPSNGCNPGWEESAAPTATSNRVCQRCPSGRYNLGGNTDACSAWSDCVPGASVLSAGTTMVDRQCSPCSPNFTYTTLTNEPLCRDVISSCPAGSGMQSGATVSSDRTCADCNRGQYNRGQFLRCADLTTCPAGTRKTTSQDSTDRDRECAPCQPGFYSERENQLYCIQTTICSVGRYPAQDPTPTMDRNCARCPAGTTSTGNNALCVTITTTATTVTTTSISGGNGDDVNSGASSEQNSESNNRNMLLVVIVIVLLVVVGAVIGAMIVVKRASVGTDRGRAAQSFENPLYDQSQPGSATENRRYDEGDDPTNADVQSGYLDVPGAKVMGSVIQYDVAGTGYMDISPNSYAEDSGEEDV